jgi:hypothetical protein
MLKIREFEFDFDISAPEDLERYLHSCKAMEERERNAPGMPVDRTSPQYLADYLAWLKAYCKLLTDWIDDVLGEGACNKLLGAKTSLSELLDLWDEIEAAATAQGEAIGRHVQKYTPNRATRRRAKAGK